MCCYNCFTCFERCFEFEYKNQDLRRFTRTAFWWKQVEISLMIPCSPFGTQEMYPRSDFMPVSVSFNQKWRCVRMLNEKHAVDTNLWEIEREWNTSIPSSYFDFAYRFCLFWTVHLFKNRKARQAFDTSFRQVRSPKALMLWPPQRKCFDGTSSRRARETGMFLLAKDDVPIETQKWW